VSCVNLSPPGGDWGNAPPRRASRHPSHRFGSRCRMVRTTRTVTSRGSQPYGAPRRDAAVFVNQGAFHRGESSSFHFWETLKVAFLSRGPADFLDQRLESGLCDESGFDESISFSGRTSTFYPRCRCLVWTTKQDDSEVGLSVRNEPLTRGAPNGFCNPTFAGRCAGQAQPLFGVPPGPAAGSGGGSF